MPEPWLSVPPAAPLEDLGVGLPPRQRVAGGRQTPTESELGESEGPPVAFGIGNRVLKRAIDLCLGVVLAIITLPTMILIALFITLDSPGPVLYVHRRVGRGGRPFPLLKFRTMRPRADAILAQHLTEDPGAAEEWQRAWKLRDDPRVTRVGRVLRRFSLDELPQVVNVILGHMSLVGPRPVVEEELPRFGPFADSIVSVRPGLTGLWAVSGRNDLSYAERVALENRYVTEWRLRRDFFIIGQTFPAVLRRRGAY
jgi:undecaprenyl-phosphate galactose phosphotransferase